MSKSAALPDPDQFSRELAARALADGRPLAWYEQLYAAAARGETAVPWDRQAPHPLLVEWADGRTAATGSVDSAGSTGGRAMVVGCGLGDDAEFLASLGYESTAFDISESAIAAVRQRFPDSPVDYRVADLLALPDQWRGAFDLVVDSMTVQSMVRSTHPSGIAAIRGLLAPGGTLLVIGVHLPPGTEPDDGPPWMLTDAEIAAFGADGVQCVDLHDEPRPDSSLVRYRAEFHRTATTPTATVPVRR